MFEFWKTTDQMERTRIDVVRINIGKCNDFIKYIFFLYPSYAYFNTIYVHFYTCILTLL
jgi:hypothetical protein